MKGRWVNEEKKRIRRPVASSTYFKKKKSRYHDFVNICTFQDVYDFSLMKKGIPGKGRDTGRARLKAESKEHFSP